MLFSIVISGFKDTAIATVSACLALECEEQKSVEVLFLDNTRDARHRAAITAVANASGSVRYISVPTPGKAAAQNVALRQCCGRYIVCLDDDVLPDSRLLREYGRAFNAYPCAAVQGRVELLFEGCDSVPSWVDHRLRLDLAEMDFGRVFYPFEVGLTGANMAFRREVFDRYGLFDERLGPGRTGTLEDQEFSERIRAGGETQLYWPDASVQHRIPPERLRVRSFARVHYDVGYSDYLLSRHLVKGGSVRFGFYTVRQILHHLGRSLASVAVGRRADAVFSYAEAFRSWGYYQQYRRSRRP